MANSQQFMDDLGPLAAIWAGRNQGQAENTQMVTQQNVLEQIATAGQNRDIASQKFPFELSQLEHQQKMNPLLLKEKEVKIGSDQQKFNKEQFSTFWDEFRNTIPQLQGSPADAALLGEVAKKHNMDPNDPRVRRMIETAGSGNQAAIQAMVRKIDEMSPKVGQTVAEEGAKASIAADPKNVPAGVRYRTDAEERWRAEDRNTRMAIAEMKASQAASAMKNRNYSQAWTYYREAAEAAFQAGNVEQGRRFNKLADEALAADAFAGGASRNTPSAGEPRVERDPQTGKPTITERPQQPMPRASEPAAKGTGASGPAATGPFTDAEKERRYQEWKAKQGK